MTKDERELIEEKFKFLHLQLDSDMTLIGKDLTFIKEQTTKTNNRVTHLEENVDKMDEEFRAEIAWGHHIVDVRALECPNVKVFAELRKDISDVKKEKSKDIDSIKEGLLEYNFMKKYPKSILIIGAFGILLVIAVIVNAINTTKGLYKIKDVDNRVELIENTVIK